MWLLLPRRRRCSASHCPLPSRARRGSGRRGRRRCQRRRRGSGPPWLGARRGAFPPTCERQRRRRRAHTCPGNAHRRPRAKRRCRLLHEAWRIAQRARLLHRQLRCGALQPQTRLRVSAGRVCGVCVVCGVWRVRQAHPPLPSRLARHPRSLRRPQRTTLAALISTPPALQRPARMAGRRLTRKICALPVALRCHRRRGGAPTAPCRPQGLVQPLEMGRLPHRPLRRLPCCLRPGPCAVVSWRRRRRSGRAQRTQRRRPRRRQLPGFPPTRVRLRPLPRRRPALRQPPPRRLPCGTAACRALRLRRRGRRRQAHPLWRGARVEVRKPTRWTRLRRWRCGAATRGWRPRLERCGPR